MKTFKVYLQNVKSSDTWFEMVAELKFEQFAKEHPNMDEDDLWDLFYDTHGFGDYANLEIEVDENLNIVGGKVTK